ncbi:hypothetical protein CPB86DRAFT_598008 [Serendipita vermifera]|nr:hypothetical protein CPB86DRAFT_598008 [Serendipita vermifera]
MVPDLLLLPHTSRIKNLLFLLQVEPCRTMHTCSSSSNSETLKATTYTCSLVLVASCHVHPASMYTAMPPPMVPYHGYPTRFGEPESADIILTAQYRMSIIEVRDAPPAPSRTRPTFCKAEPRAYLFSSLPPSLLKRLLILLLAVPRLTLCQEAPNLQPISSMSTFSQLLIAH